MVTKVSDLELAPGNDGPLRVRIQELNVNLVDRVQSGYITVVRGKSCGIISFVKLNSENCKIIDDIKLKRHQGRLAIEFLNLL